MRGCLLHLLLGIHERLPGAVAGGGAGVCFPAGCSVAVFFNGADIYCRGLLRNPEMGRAAGVRPYRRWSSLEMDLLSLEI